MFVKVVIIIFVVFVNSSAQVDLDKGLLAYYPFSGGAENMTNNDLNGEVYGPILGDDYFGVSNSAYYFDGVDDYIIIEDNDYLDFELKEDFAISFCFKNGFGIGGDLLSKWESAHKDTSYSYAVRLVGYGASDTSQWGKILVARYDGDDLNCEGGVSIKTNESYLDTNWHSLVFQLNSSNELELYIDGSLAGKISDSNVCSIISNSNIVIGSRSSYHDTNNRAFKGGIDELRFYNRSLNEDEVLELHKKVMVPSKEIDYSSYIKIFPNPTSGAVTLINSSSKEIRKSFVYDISGTIINEFQKEINLSNYPVGVYFVKVIFEDGFQKELKLIKN